MSEYRCRLVEMPGDDKPLIRSWNVHDLVAFQVVFEQLYNDEFRLVETHDLYGLNVTLLVFRKDDHAADADG